MIFAGVYEPQAHALSYNTIAAMLILSPVFLSQSPVMFGLPVFNSC